ncbi:MAG: hypothetical protein H8D47_04080 [Planctomycetes bacterium]|nr:hypothetical protein [Planctomycetota bacterium]MBL7107302.1 hypothetical protein [Phycisphaerae bacterium]
MNNTLKKLFFCAAVVSLLVSSGCGKRADETKPISEVKAEAEKMSVTELQSMALKYKNAITAKKNDLEKSAAKLKEIKIAKLMDDEAKRLKADIETVEKSIKALTQRFTVYYDKLKEKGGDLSGLNL